MQTYTAVPVAGAKNFRTALGEGAIWDSHSDLLFFVDIDGRIVHSYSPESGHYRFKRTAQKVSTVVKRSKRNQLIIATGHSFETLSQDLHWQAERDFATLASVELEPNVRFNDGKCDSAGRLWCGTMDLDEAEGKGQLYMLDIDHSVHKKLDDVTISNGIAWSLDNKIMYYVDTPKGTVDAFDFDLATGEITNRRVAVKNVWGGHFDGMTLDSEGHLYIALWGGSRVIGVDPLAAEDKQLIATIDLPDTLNVTSCAFGGDDLTTLFITTATTKCDVKTYTSAGLVHQVKMKTKGLPAQQYKG